MPAKAALYHVQHCPPLLVPSTLYLIGDPGIGVFFILADEVSIAPLLVIESFEVLLNLQPDNRGWLISEIVDKLLGVHGGQEYLMPKSSGDLWERTSSWYCGSEGRGLE